MAEAALWRRDLFDNIARSVRYTYEQSEEDRRAEKKRKRKLLDDADRIYTLLFFSWHLYVYT